MSRPKAAQTWQPRRANAEEADWENLIPLRSGAREQEYPMWQTALLAVAVGRGLRSASRLLATKRFTIRHQQKLKEHYSCLPLHSVPETPPLAAASTSASAPAAAGLAKRLRPQRATLSRRRLVRVRATVSLTRRSIAEAKREGNGARTGNGARLSRLDY